MHVPTPHISVRAQTKSMDYWFSNVFVLITNDNEMAELLTARHKLALVHDVDIYLLRCHYGDTQIVELQELQVSVDLYLQCLAEELSVIRGLPSCSAQPISV